MGTFGLVASQLVGFLNFAERDKKSQLSDFGGWWMWSLECRKGIEVVRKILNYIPNILRAYCFFALTTCIVILCGYNVRPDTWWTGSDVTSGNLGRRSINIPRLSSERNNTCVGYLSCWSSSVFKELFHFTTNRLAFPVFEYIGCVTTSVDRVLHRTCNYDRFISSRHPDRVCQQFGSAWRYWSDSRMQRFTEDPLNCFVATIFVNRPLLFAIIFTNIH